MNDEETYRYQERQTVFSHCRKYRYTLWREWPTDQMQDGCNDGERGIDNLRGYVMFIGLNPSTADETKDDPTIRRCRDFAQRWGYGALCMTNLFAWRDTQPANMKKAAWPIGADNDHWLLEIAKGAGLVVAAWGTHGTHLYRAVKVKAMFREAGIQLQCIYKTKDGHPQHPLYLSSLLLPELL